jgi:hypothetical protein
VHIRNAQGSDSGRGSTAAGIYPTELSTDRERGAGISRTGDRMMLLSSLQRHELLAKYGCYAMECCDSCRRILGPVCFTRRGCEGVWCSRECRGDGERRTIRKGGRPPKYKTEHERREAERRQNVERQRAFRAKTQSNGKPSRSFAETKDLQVQKTRLRTTPLPSLFRHENRAFAKAGAKAAKQWRVRYNMHSI